MNASTKTTTSRVYEPGRTLGRSGYQRDPVSHLCAVLEHLDALLCTISAGGGADGEPNDFQRLNNVIQCSVLDLASDLATEAHELHEQLRVRGDGGAK